MSKHVIKRAVTGQVDKIIRPAPLVDDSYMIIQRELERLGVLSMSHGLDERTTKQFQMLVRTLIDLRKEERDSAKSDTLLKELQGLSTEELVKLAQQELTKDSE